MKVRLNTLEKLRQLRTVAGEADLLDELPSLGPDEHVFTTELQVNQLEVDL